MFKSIEFCDVCDKNVDKPDYSGKATIRWGKYSICGDCSLNNFYRVIGKLLAKREEKLKRRKIKEKKS